jgi:hypothetical protein
MPDLLEQIRKQLDERRGELRPAVEEYQTLERALELLGGPAKRDGRQTAGRRSSSKPRRQKQAARGERVKQLLPLLRENPEVTPGNLALLLDTTPQNVSVILSRLRRQGVISRDGKRWLVAAEPE